MPFTAEPACSHQRILDVENGIINPEGPGRAKTTSIMTAG